MSHLCSGTLLVGALALVGLGACGGSSGSSPRVPTSRAPTADANSDIYTLTRQENFAAQQAVQSGDDAGNATAATQGYASAASKPQLRQADLFAPYSGVDRRMLGAGIAAQIACFGDVQGSVSGDIVDVQVHYNGALCKHGSRSVDGNEHIILDRSSRTLSIQSKVDTTFKNGEVLSRSSIDPAGYNVVLTRSGSVASGTVGLDITLNERRVRRGSDGNVIFDHNLTTPEGSLKVTNTYNSSVLSATLLTPTARVLNGVVQVTRLRTNMQAVHTFTDLTRDLTGACACPSSGKLQQVASRDAGQPYATGFTRVYTFTGCGTATVETSASTTSQVPNGSSTVVWDNCQ